MGKLRVYLARAMTGRTASEVYKEACFDRDVFEEAGFEVLDPVLEERIQPSRNLIGQSKAVMNIYWPRDKEMIRKAHVFIDCTPNLKSQGVEREAGYARYFLFKPVVRKFPMCKLPNNGSVAFFEDDVITDSYRDVVEQIKGSWGTSFRRFMWRVKLLRKLPKSLAYKLWVWINDVI